MHQSAVTRETQSEPTRGADTRCLAAIDTRVPRTRSAGTCTPRLTFHVEFRLREPYRADLVAQNRVANQPAGAADLPELVVSEFALVTIRPFAVGVSRVYRRAARGGAGDHLHQRIPEALSLEQTLARSGFARNLDRLAAAAQRGANAIRGAERARRVGIRKRGQQFAQILRIGVQPRPTEARSAAHQAAPQQEFADPPFVLAGDAQHVLHQFANREVLHHHWRDGDGLRSFGAELDPNGGRQRHRFSR